MNKELHVKINARHRIKQREIKLKLKLKKEYYEKIKSSPIAIINKYTFDIMFEHSRAIAKLYENLSDYI